MRAGHQAWSAADVRKLRKLYPDTPAKSIARKLARRIGSVRGMAALLGLKKSARFLAGPLSGRRYKGCVPTSGKAWTKVEVAYVKAIGASTGTSFMSEIDQKPSALPRPDAGGTGTPRLVGSGLAAKP